MSRLVVPRRGRAVRFRARQHIRLIVLILATLVATGTAKAQDKSSEPEVSPRWREFYKEQAAEYRFETVEPMREKLAMQPQPVMQWLSLNDYNGDVFVWTRQGRPEVVGSIFSRPVANTGQRHLLHEFYSFSEETIEGVNRRGKAFSFDKGIASRPIPDAPVPANNPAARQLQARALARQFSARMEREGERWSLRLLSQPLYRYEGSSDNVLGGAVFAFVGYVTDPEILLLVEARKTGAGPAWSYAAARFSNKSLWLSHNETEVWSFANEITAASAKYYFASAGNVTLPPDKP